MRKKLMKDTYGKSLEKFRVGCERIDGEITETRQGLTCENKEGEISMDEEMVYVKSKNDKVGGSLYPNVGVIVPAPGEKKRNLEEEYDYSGVQQLVITNEGGRIGLKR